MHKIKIYFVLLLSAVSTACVNTNSFNSNLNSFQNHVIEKSNNLNQTHIKEDLDNTKHRTKSSLFNQIEFKNTQLNLILNSIVENNPSILIALAKMKNAKNQIDLANSLTNPNLSVSGYKNSIKTTTQNSLLETENETNTKSANNTFTFGWEMDIFGKHSGNQTASVFTYKSKEDDLNDILLALKYDAVNLYFNFLKCHSNLDILKQDFLSREKILKVTEVKYKNDLTSSVDLSRQTASFNEAKLNMINQEESCIIIAQEIYKISNFKISNPEDVNLEFTNLYDQFNFDYDINLSQLLNRYDIKSSINLLLASIAAEDSAKKAFLPTINLSSTIGSTVTGILTTNVITTAILASFSIFDGGKNLANTEIANAKTAEAYGNFLIKINQVVKDLSDVILKINSSREKIQLSHSAFSNYSKYYQINLAKYNNGLTAILDLEDALRTKLNSQINLNNSFYDRFSLNLNLHKALAVEIKSDLLDVKQRYNKDMEQVYAK